MITGVALVASSVAYAADADDNVTTTGELVVTGSRIPQPNLTSVSPVTSVNNAEIKLQGTSTVEDLINSLPQAIADFGNFESNGATGTATVNLRGLGNKRTLVLVNGTRLMPGDPTSAAVAADINMIPPALIDRVEVLTGGASAVYGSDAVAGVVNFIMKRHFQGIQIDAQTSFAHSGGGNQQVRTADANAQLLGTPAIDFPGSVTDGWRHTVTISGGANTPDDKGSVEFYVGYTYIKAVDEGQRDYSKCSLATNNTSTSFQYCGGSSTNAFGRLTPTSGPHAGSSYNVLGTPVGGLLPPRTHAQDFNYAPYNYFQRPDKRWTAGFFGEYEITPMFDVYSSFMFMDDHSVAAIAPSGSFYGDRIFTIPCDNPQLSTAQRSTLCGPGPYLPGQTASAQLGRRNVEGGPRIADLEHTDFRAQVGMKGDLGSGWNYDVNLQYGRAVLNESQTGYFLYSHLLNAMNVTTDTRPGLPTTGTAQCASFINGTDTKCVPYNIWSPGGVTAAALNYLTGPANNSGETAEAIVTAVISNADLGQYGLKSPGAHDGVGISAGVEYRRETLQTHYDAVIFSGDLAGFGGSLANTAGSQADGDFFLEARIPLVQDAPFAKDLTLETGYRYANYTHGGGANAFKVGLDWQTVPDLRLRGSFERAVRAPNVQELFQPRTPGLFAGSDPCAGANPTLTAAQCVNTFSNTLPGITVAQLTNGGYVYQGNVLPALYGAAANNGLGIAQCVSGQCGNFAGGNPNLVPETADTWSVGFVLTPEFLKGFSLTLDYWNVKVEKAIINLPGQTMLLNCATLGNAFDCAHITRYTGGNQFTIYGGNGGGFVDLELVNASELSTSGIDINAIYKAHLADWGLGEHGALTFSFTGTYTHKLVTVLPDNTGYDCAGLYGVTCGVPTPKWRHNLRTTWSTPWNFDVSLNWRFIGKTTLDFNTNQPDLQNGFKDDLKTDARIPAYSYFDLAATWRVRDNITLRGGINNLFDREPPLLDSNSFGISAPPFGNGNTYPQVFDPLGRVFFLGVTADF